MSFLHGLDALGAEKLSSAQERESELQSTTALTLVGGVVGGLLWKKHRVLGVFVGSGLGRGASSLMDGEDALEVASVVGFAAAGYLVSRLWEVHPVVGFLAGSVLGEMTVLKALGKAK